MNVFANGRCSSKRVVLAGAIAVLLVLSAGASTPSFAQTPKARPGGAPKSKSSDSGVSSFQALAMTLAGRVGTGNIAGVATAITFGGPGAVFWMWMTAFLGASSAYVESTLGQIYKEKING